MAKTGEVRDIRLMPGWLAMVFLVLALLVLGLALYLGRGASTPEHEPPAEVQPALPPSPG